MIELIALATCFVVLTSLWIRRQTWHYRWEQPKTIGLTFIGAGTLIKAPPLGWLLDHYVLHGLHLLIAHIFIVSGIAAIAYSAEHKLRPDPCFRRWHNIFVVVPWNIGVGTMVGLFAGGARHTLDQRFQFPDGDAMAYWLTYDILTVYFLILCAYALLGLINDHASRGAASVYLAAVGFAFFAATCRALLATVDDGVPNALLIDIAYTANAIALSLWAIGAAYTWRIRLRRIDTARRKAMQQSVSKNTLV